MKSLCRSLYRTAGGLCLVFGAAQTTLASDLMPFTTVFDTDITMAGYGGMRGIGTGSLSLSGVGTGTISKAYLYWHGPGTSTDPDANAMVTFNGTGITGTALGLSSDNCWGFNNSKGYRADVSSLVSGDGDYTLANFAKNGEDINGVSLIVFFNDGDTNNNRDVVIFDGNDSNISNPYDADNWNIALNGINYSGGSANITWHVADGQIFPDASLVVNGNELVPAGPNFDGNTTPGGPGGAGNGFLWDIRKDDITSILNPGLNNLTVSSGVNSDCLACIAILIDLPAGAAPPTETDIPLPGTLSLLGLGLLLGLARRRQLYLIA